MIFCENHMIRAIINADDFGLSRGINDGIITAHQNGILTSATLMANMPGFDHAVGLAQNNPKLGVGIHLNIVRKNGVQPEEIEREFRAQIEKTLAAGIRISHLDSEKHAHTIPLVFGIAVKLASEYKIQRIRFINEVCLTIPLTQSFKSWLISYWCSSMKKKIRKSGIMITDRFYGLCKSGRMTAARLKKILKSLGEGTAEIMVHPGFVTPELADLEPIIGSYYINQFREAELKALLDDGLMEIVRARDIRLINFHELRDDGQQRTTA
jgi:predicted glycoside hydrolase/deacetylase ChbG (UPF0249 family)